MTDEQHNHDVCWNGSAIAWRPSYLS